VAALWAEGGAMTRDQVIAFALSGANPMAGDVARHQALLRETFEPSRPFSSR
jgi:hypothetical protein